MPEAATGTPERVAANLVTSENREAFINKRLDIAAPLAPAPEPKPATLATVAEVKPEPKVEVKGEPDAELEEVIAEAQQPKPEEKKKQAFRERLSELANQRKEAQAKVAQEQAARQKAEKERDELRAKITAPPPPDPEIGPAPKREDFGTEAEYMDARDAHLIKRTRAEDRKLAAEARAKEEADARVRTYGERLTAVKAELTDFDAKIEAAKDLPIPPHIQEAMLESEVGPRIAYYFAEHRDEHARLLALRPAAALRELGKIESMLESTAKAAKPAPAASAAPAKPAVEVTTAPAPITPIKGTTAAVDTKVDSEGRFTGTYAEYKALRKAGKLK